jgi:hypothetical protein
VATKASATPKPTRASRTETANQGKPEPGATTGEKESTKMTGPAPIENFESASDSVPFDALIQGLPPSSEVFAMGGPPDDEIV